MPVTGDPTTGLVVLRGNSGSGKSTTAQEVRRRVGRGVAWIEQDHFRRIVLRELDEPGAANIGLIDQAARYALGAGYHVIVEGILHAVRYGDMLRRLVADHAGRTGVYYFRLSFDETVRRHGTRALAQVVTPEQMVDWYEECDLLGVPGEQVVEAGSTLDDTVHRIITDLAWAEGD